MFVSGSENLIRKSGNHCGAAGKHFVERRKGLADSEAKIVHPNGAIEMASQ